MMAPDRFEKTPRFENRARLSRRSYANANRKFEVDKGSQLFIRLHNETLSVVAVRVCNPDSFTWSAVLSAEVKRFIASVLTVMT